MLIREATPGELPEIEHLVKSAYQEFQSFMPEGIWERWMDNISEALRAAGGLVLVAEADGEIVGAVTFFPDAGQAHQGHWPKGAAAIRLLAVRPDRRGQGYGTRLTRACLAQARKLKIRTIFLYTGTFMTAARRLYEKLGFKRAPEFESDPGPMAYRWELE